MTIAAVVHQPHNGKLSQATKCNSTLSPEFSSASSLKFCLQIVKLWTLPSPGGAGCFYVSEYDMLKTSESSYILLTLHHNHLIHFRVSELFWQYSKCILMESIFIRTEPLHSTELTRILSQGFPPQAKLWHQKVVALFQILYP